MSFVGVLADRRLATRTRKFEEIIDQLSLARQQVEGSQRELQEQKLRLDSAINNMGEGLCMFDAEKRLVVCNDRYAKMYRLPPELLRAGTPHREIIKHRITQRHPQGRDQRQRREQLISTLNALPSNVTSSRIDEFADGRLICVTRQPMAGGGWVATHLDVTEQRRSEAKITHMAQHDALTDLPNRVLLQGASGARPCHHAQGRHRPGGAHARSRPLQGGQRHARASGGRRAAASRRRAAAGASGKRLDRPAGRRRVRRHRVRGKSGWWKPLSLAERIKAALCEPFDLGDHQVTAGTSIGIAIAPRDGDRFR